MLGAPSMSTRKPPSTITLQLSGAPHCGAQPLAPADALLLAWLAIQGPTPRERLAALLWPGSSADAARNALRQRLFRLRRQAGADLVTGPSPLQLAPNVVHDLAGAATLLGTLAADAGSELEAWLQAERTRRREQQRQGLLAHITQHEQAGDVAAALPMAQALVALDPLREDGHRQLMRLHYLAGDRAAALRAFDACEALLKHELGTRPSPETLALLATLEAAEPGLDPVAAHPAMRRSLPAALMRPPRLVGRDAELARLRRVLDAGGRLVVTGEAGLGKSRLLQALAATPPAPLMAAGRPGDALAPYATLARALRALQARAPQAIARVPAAHLAPLLPELAPTLTPGSEFRLDAMKAALAGVLREAMSLWHAIVLDDLHFADEATLQLLPELIAAVPGGAWLLSLRPPADGSAQAALLSTLAGAAPLESLALAPLDPAALAALVDSLGLPGIAGARLAPQLAARSGGNPLFALETLKLAWTEGHAIDAGELPRPRSVGQLIDTALSALSPPALLLARVAAIAGVDFSIELAEAVLRQGALQLADAWAEAEQRQVLRGSAFTHDLMLESVLAGIPDVLARHAHGQIAHWLEAHGGEPARVAAHWEAAGQRERALPSLRAAADRAHAAMREGERVAFLLRAADIAESQARGDEAFELVSAAVEAHMNTVRDEAGLPLLDRLDRLAHSPRLRASAAGHRAWYRLTLGDGAGAIEIGRQALALAGAVDDAGLRASIAQRLGTALGMAGLFDEAVAHLRLAEPWVEAHAGSDLAAEFDGNLAAILDNLGRPGEAQPYHRRVIAATVALGDPSFVATARANFAVSRLNAGDAAGAQAQLTLAQQLISGYELTGSSAGFVAAQQAHAARALGDYAQALAWCDNAEALLAQASPGRLPFVQLQRAQVLLDLAQHARARQLLDAIDVGALPPRLKARHGHLNGRLQQALGHDATALFAAALAHAPADGWPELRLSLRIECAASRSGAAVLAELGAVADAAGGMGLTGIALAAWLRACALATSARAARDAARRVLAIDPGIEPNPLYRGERWLGPALAARRASDAARAQAIAREGWQWAQHTARQAVPAAMRETFLHRHPVNQALQRLITAP